MPSDTEGRVEVFRHYAQIYGRFDAKRRPDKALTQHERIINEAAVQVALLRPELLTRRDELFPLARKVFYLLNLLLISKYKNLMVKLNVPSMNE